MLSAAARCPASGGVPNPRGYVAGQLGVVSSVLMSPFLMCVLPVAPFRINEPRSKIASQVKVLTGGRRLAHRASRRPRVCKPFLRLTL